MRTLFVTMQQSRALHYLCRTVCLEPLLHLGCRCVIMLIGCHLRMAHQHPAHLDLFCTDPGRLEFQVGLPSEPNRQRLRADTEI